MLMDCVSRTSISPLSHDLVAGCPLSRLSAIQARRGALLSRETSTDPLLLEMFRSGGVIPLAAPAADAWTTWPRHGQCAKP